MGVKTEGRRSATREKESEKHVGIRTRGEGVSTEAEDGATNATLSSKQDECIKVEVTWKIANFAEKMRVQDSVTLTKEINLDRHLDTRAGYDSCLLHAVLHPRVSLDASFTPVHLTIKGGITGVGCSEKNGVTDKPDSDINIKVETFVIHETGKRKYILDEKIDYEFLLYQNSGLTFVWAHKDTLTVGVAASMTFSRGEEWALWDHGAHRLDDSAFDLRMRKINRMECMNILSNVLSAMPTDILLRVGRKSVSAHKAVLAEHSRVIAAMMKANPKFSEIEIEDVSLAAVKEFKIFCYTGEVPNVAALGEELLLFCDSYDIESMARAVDAFLMRALSVNAVVRTLLLADCHKRKDLRTRCITFVEKNHAAVYQTDAWKKLKEFSMELFEEVIGKVSQSTLTAKEEEETADAVADVNKKNDASVVENPLQEKPNPSPAQPIPPQPETGGASQPAHGIRQPQFAPQPRMPFHPQMMQQAQMAYQQQMQQQQMQQHQLQHQMMQQQQTMQYPPMMQYPQMPNQQAMFAPPMMPNFGGVPAAMGNQAQDFQNQFMQSSMPFSGNHQQPQQPTSQPNLNSTFPPQNMNPGGFMPQMGFNQQMPQMPPYHQNVPASMPSSMSASFHQGFPGQIPTSTSMPGDNPMAATGQSMYADPEMNKLLASLPPIPTIDNSTFNESNPSVESVNRILKEHEDFMKTLSQSPVPSQESHSGSELIMDPIPKAEVVEEKPEVKSTSISQEIPPVEEKKAPVVTEITTEENTGVSKGKSAETVSKEKKENTDTKEKAKKKADDTKHKAASTVKKAQDEAGSPSGKPVEKGAPTDSPKPSVKSSDVESKSVVAKTRKEEKVDKTSEADVKAKATSASPKTKLTSDSETVSVGRSRKSQSRERSVGERDRGARSKSKEVAETADTRRKTQEIFEETPSATLTEASSSSGGRTEKMAALMEKNDKWKKMVDSFSEETMDDEEGVTEASSKPTEEVKNVDDKEENWQKVTTPKPEVTEEEAWEKVTELKKPQIVEEDEDEWEKVTSVRVMGKKEKRSTPVTTEEKWVNVNSEMKMKLDGRREVEEDDDEWKKVTEKEEEEEAPYSVDEQWVKMNVEK